MNIQVVESTMVKPAISTPATTMWMSNMDVWMPMYYHVRLLYLYRGSGGADFFDPAVLKLALSRALTEFYPLAGRLQKNAENKRVEINCDGQGALFVEAEATDGDVDDLLGDGLVPRADDVRLTPDVDYSKGISSYPLLLAQVTRFKRGGVCLGIAMDHHVCDGVSGFHFISTWSRMARGSVADMLPPFLDRTVLRARDPPHPKFPHIEYHSPPPLVLPTNNSSDLKFSIFKLTRDQLNALKTNYKEEEGVTTTLTTNYYSTFEVMVSHLWRCVTQARGLPENQETRMYIPVDGRSRLQPPLSPGYLGNVVFMAAVVASCEELVKSAGPVVARKIREALRRMDDEYLRSALDYLELDQEKEKAKEDCLSTNGSSYACPNLSITSWGRMPIYDVDFGWGKPFYVGLGAAPPEGLVFVMPDDDDGGFLCAISMPEQQMGIFQKLLYQIS